MARKPKPPKPRNHNEWFRPVSLGNRKSCPSCHAKLLPGEWIWSWGEYHYGKWRTVDHFCRSCFPRRVQSRLLDHSGDCGCTITLQVQGACPSWLTLEQTKGQITQSCCPNTVNVPLDTSDREAAAASVIAGRRSG